jgi:putative membrane protein
MSVSPVALDLLLAFGHHLGIFTIFGVLAAELAMLRLSPSVPWVQGIAKVDQWYGLGALTVLGAGISRVVWGLKGPAYYLDYPVFWAKMGLFVVIALISIRPTVAFVRWRRNAAATGTLPSAPEVASVRGFVVAQILLFTGLPFLAATMARAVGR